MDRGTKVAAVTTATIADFNVYGFETAAPSPAYLANLAPGAADSGATPRWLRGRLAR
ncbi:MAG: hypothetical protein LBH06_05540 [Rikenellaceae bacterium]|nr:hypothetical protein [Rikenellaceae bacterium]